MRGATVLARDRERPEVIPNLQLRLSF
jgi:hypothetical protein